MPEAASPLLSSSSLLGLGPMVDPGALRGVVVSTSAPATNARV